MHTTKKTKKEMGAGGIVGTIFGVIAAIFLVWHARNSGWFSKKYRITGPDEIKKRRRNSAVSGDMKRIINDDIKLSKLESTLAYVKGDSQYKDLSDSEKREVAWNLTHPTVSFVPRFLTTTAKQYRSGKEAVVSTVDNWENENGDTWLAAAAKIVVGPPPAQGTHR